MAFRSEEFGWKQQVHLAHSTIENDRAAAYGSIAADDGFSLAFCSGTIASGKLSPAQHRFPT